jgi:hypothetical protein
LIRTRSSQRVSSSLCGLAPWNRWTTTPSHEIDTQQDINALLLKDRATVLRAPERQLSESHFKSRNPVQGMMKASSPSESLAFIGCRARRLIRQAIVEVSA